MPDTAKILADLAEFESRPVAKLGEFEFSAADLRKAFDMVAPAANWKTAIDAECELATQRDKVAVHLAVPFFTGSRPTLWHLGGTRYRVTAAGYYATCGA